MSGEDYARLLNRDALRQTGVWRVLWVVDGGRCANCPTRVKSDRVATVVPCSWIPIGGDAADGVDECHETKGDPFAAWSTPINRLLRPSGTPSGLRICAERSTIQRGLAWLDVINARLHGNEASVAQQFSNEHSEHTIRPMLDGAHDATE